MRAKFTFLALIAMAAFCAPFAAQAATATGGADDVPTWKAGDRWDFKRSFRLQLNIAAFGLINLPLPLNFVDNHRKLMSSVKDVTNGTTTSTGVKVTTAYERLRDAANTTFSVSGSGSQTTLGTTVSIDLGSPPAVQTNGYDWTGVGDLALVRESLATASPLVGVATFAATGALAGLVCDQLEAALVGLNCDEDGAGADIGTNAYNLNFSLSLDHGAITAAQSGGLEYLDFPATELNEAWNQSIRRNISGVLDLNVSNGALELVQAFEAGLDGGFTGANTVKVTGVGVASPAPGAFAGSTKTEGRFQITGVGQAATNDVVFFNPAAKDMVSWVLGDITSLISIVEEDFTVTGDLLGFKTTIDAGGDVEVDGSSAVTNVSYETGDATPLGASGGTVCVSGTATAGAAVSAVLLLPGGNAAPVNTTAGGDGSFSVQITVPANDDDSVMSGAVNLDQGSFGLAIYLDGAPSPAKVATIRRSSTAGAGFTCPVETESPTPTPSPTDTPSPTETPVETLTPTPTPTASPTPGGCETGGRSVGDFDCSGCTDITDFLTLLDNWQLIYDGALVGIEDFLALLDNWNSGPNCP